jgi:hypothetical protein
MCLDVLPEVMILNDNMLCAGCKLWIVCHGHARLIVLPNFENKLFGFGMCKGEMTFISCIKLVIDKVSLRACDKAIYSISAVERAIYVCNLLCQNIGHPS